jgi:hypothetical protein
MLHYCHCSTNKVTLIDVTWIICMLEDFLHDEKHFFYDLFYDRLCFKLNNKFWEEQILCFPLMRHRPHRKWHIWRLIYCRVCIRCCKNLLTELLASIGRVEMRTTGTQTARWSHKRSVIFCIMKVGCKWTFIVTDWRCHVQILAGIGTVLIELIQEFCKYFGQWWNGT